MCESGKPLSSLVSGIEIYPQVLVNVKVAKPKKIERYPSLITAIRKAQKGLVNGRILVRPSGTEPKIRVMVEGDDMDTIKDIAGGIAEAIKRIMK
jgi:phosphoglucosamine mutase